MKKLLGILVLGLLLNTSAHSLSSFAKHAGQGELKIPKNTFDIIEFYFSAGKYGEIYNNPQYDWQKKMIKEFDWRGMFIILSQNGKGLYWYRGHTSAALDMSNNYLGKARNKCTEQGYGECFVFAIKDKIVWQNGINPKKGTKIKKKEARNGMVSIKLKELGFYDGGITKTKKIEKKKEEKKKEPKKKKKKETKKKTTSSSDLADQIKELKQLLDDGIITEEEFTKAKKKLLD